MTRSIRKAIPMGIFLHGTKVKCFLRDPVIGFNEVVYHAIYTVYEFGSDWDWPWCEWTALLFKKGGMCCHVLGVGIVIFCCTICLLVLLLLLLDHGIIVSQDGSYPATNDGIGFHKCDFDRKHSSFGNCHSSGKTARPGAHDQHVIPALLRLVHIRHVQRPQLTLHIQPWRHCRTIDRRRWVVLTVPSNKSVIVTMIILIHIFRFIPVD